jgi:AbrB family looped-hinge helix DNA binding protein
MSCTPFVLAARFTFYDYVKGDLSMRLSSKNQIVIPKEAREALGLVAGDELMVTVRNGYLVVRKKPKSFTDALSGLFEGLTYPPDYVKNERKSWD